MNEREPQEAAPKQPLSETQLKDVIRGTGWNIECGTLTKLSRRVSDRVAERLELPETEGLVTSIVTDGHHTEVFIKAPEFSIDDLETMHAINQSIEQVKEGLQHG